MKIANSLSVSKFSRIARGPIKLNDSENAPQRALHLNNLQQNRNPLQTFLPPHLLDPLPQLLINYDSRELNLFCLDLPLFACYLLYRSAICLPQNHSETAITTPANNIENPLEKVTGR